MWLLLLLIGLRECGLCLQGKLLWLFIERNIYLPSKGVASVLIFLEFFVLIIKQVRHHFANKVPYSQSYGIPSSHVWMWELDHKEGWAPKNWCFQIVVLENSGESLGQQGDQISQSQRKSILNIYWKNWSWSSSTLATWCEELTHWKRPWCWERLRAGREEGDRGWDGWMASLTQWTWVCTNSRDSEGQGSLASCRPWDYKGLDMI